MERHRIGPLASRAMLAQAALEHGVEETVLAGALLELLSPPPDAPTAAVPDRHPATGIPSGPSAAASQLLMDLPSVRASAAAVVRAVDLANQDGSAAAQLIADLTRARPDRTVIYGVAEDTLVMMGSVGVPADVVEAWRRLPLALSLPLCLSVSEDRAIFLDAGAEMEGAFPATLGSREGTGAWASVPIREGTRVTGVVGLSWLNSTTFDEARRANILRAVERAGPLMVRSLPTLDPAPSILTELMHLIPDEWVVLSSTGSAADMAFVVDAVAPSLSEKWLGRELLDVFPGLSRSGDIVTDLRQVRSSGAALTRTITATAPGGPPWEKSGVEVRLVRSGRLVVLTWRQSGSPGRGD
jgi:hypothetical protein